MSPVMSATEPTQRPVVCGAHHDLRKGHISRSELVIARREVDEMTFYEAWCTGGAVPSAHHVQAREEALRHHDPYIYAAGPELQGWALLCPTCQRIGIGLRPWVLLGQYFTRHCAQCAQS